MWSLAGNVGAAVDTFNNAVGEIGTKIQPDLFNSPVGAIGAQPVVADSKQVVAEIKAQQTIEALQAPQSGPLAADSKQVVAEVQAPQATKSKLWSYQPVQAPAEPTVKNKQWVRTPIDAFVLAPIEAKGLTPSPDADRAAFVRRATLDVWGVIPTPEEVQAFVNDTSDNAYEKLADRLLSSPKYGERQGRKWLDLARYADSTGFEVDSDRLNSWRYRDYVVNSFNQDKPYSRFLEEQLAGDELWPDKEEALIATGFMAQFPDNSNSRDLIQRKYQITTDITDTVGKVVLGQTVECARCHNHKFDKISQKDYFSLQAFFANIAPVDNIPAKKGEVELAYDQQMAKWLEATKDIRDKQKAIIDTHREEALKYHKERYLTDSRVSVFKPKSEWTPLDRWVNHRVAQSAVTNEFVLQAVFKENGGSTQDAALAKDFAEKGQELNKLNKELTKFNHLKPATSSNTISAMTELGHPDAPPTFVLAVGDHEKPLEEVQPAFPSAITDEKPDIKPLSFSSGRRSALVKWLTSPTNPLTARVYVNRVWDQYFGRGIVETVSDFGKAGQKPTNPELLDYLAAKFVKDGWSIKSLHKEILLSSVYRQSSDHREDVHQADIDNKLLAVFPRQRLEAEQVRDSLLVAAGKLEDKVGGPSVYAPLPKNVDGGDNGGFGGDRFWKPSKDVHDHNRRSLYIFTRRSMPYPILDSFNMASPQEAHSKRQVTTTPLQALTLFNSELIFDWSKSLAGRVINESGAGESERLDRLYQILLGRNARNDEKDSLQAFLNDQEKVIREKTATGKFEVNVPTGLKNNVQIDPVRAAAFVELVHVVANSNEFIYRF